jgi:hypothetical protein
MVDASEIAFVAVFLASDKAWAVSGELVAATGGPGGRFLLSSDSPKMMAITPITTSVLARTAQVLDLGQRCVNGRPLT